MVGRRLGRAARPRRFDEHVELGGLPSRQRLPIRRGAGRDRTAVELMQTRGDAIHDVPRHHAIRRQLPAGDRDEAMRAFEHSMFARHLRRIRMVFAKQRPQPHPCRDDVIRAQMRVRKRGVRRAQQIRHVRRRHAQFIGRSIGVGIGGADVGEIVPRQHEHHPAIDLRHQGHRMLVAQAPARHGHVRPFGEPQDRRRVRIVELPEPVGPGAGRVHHHIRADVCGLARQYVAHDRTAHSSVGPEQRRRLDIIGRERPGANGAAHRCNDQAGVVGLRVVIQRRADETAVPQPRLDAPHLLGAEPAMPAHVAEYRQQIVQPHAGAQLPRRNPAAAIDGKEERERPHQMRRDPEQHLPFVTCFEDQVERALLEIPDAAVDEAR